MKNNLYEKYKSPKVDDNANPNKGIPIRADEPEEPSKFVQFLKYTVIIACCLVIPFYMNSGDDKVVDDIVADVKDGFKDATEAPKIVASSNSGVLPSFVSSILKNTLAELQKAAENPDLKDSERAKIKEAIEKIELKMAESVEESQSELNHATKLAIEDALGQLEVQIDGFDENELNSIINQSVNSALQGLSSLSQLENLKDLKDLKNLNINVPPVPPVPPVPGVSNSNSKKLDIPYLDYLSELKENGLFKTYQEYELKSFYENGIEIDQILEWRDNGLTDLMKPWELTQLHNNDIDASEMNPWIKGGFLKDYQSYEIVNFIENDVTPEYVSEFKKNGYNKKFQFYEITNFFDSDITIQDLKVWDKAGYLDLYESHEIVNFIENDVPPSFLKMLDQKGLLKDLQFYEITKLYNESDN